MEHHLRAADAAAETVPGAVELRRLFGPERGCRTFSQRLLRLEGRSGERVDPGADELLYALEGEGTVGAGGETANVAPGSGVFVARGTPWSAEAEGSLLVLSVLVHDPEPATATHGFVSLTDGAAARATAGRQFTLGATPECGCASATQFVGFIPPGRAPDHFHTYDEVVYVLEGDGVLHIGGEQAALAPGSCVHLPARLVHSLENTGGGTMRVLGVFRPAGSPAEAYYPDGTPAVVPEA